MNASLHRSNPKQLLTDKEQIILELVALGKTNATIGHLTGVSEDTVKTHMKKMLARLGVANRAHAVAVGFQTGLLGGDSRVVFREATQLLRSQMIPFMSSHDADHIIDRVSKVAARGLHLRQLERTAA